MNIAFSGDCSVNNAVAVRQELLRGLASNEAVTLSFAGITDLDVSFFELLHAAKRSFAENGRELAWTPDLPEAFRQQAAWTGWSGLGGG